MPSSVSITATRSPFFRPSFRRTSAGKVTWPFSWTRTSFGWDAATVTAEVRLSYTVESNQSTDEACHQPHHDSLQTVRGPRLRLPPEGLAHQSPSAGARL